MHPDLIWYDNGQSGYGGALLALSRRLDAMFCGWAQERSASEYMYPPFLRAKDLAKIDYLRSFPHLATFPVTLDPDEGNIDAFLKELPPGSDAIPLTRTRGPEDVLTPAACYHVYVMLQDEVLGAPRMVTTRGTCFRQEETHTPLERQWGFSMREIVCVGTSEEVRSFLGDMQGKLETFLAELKLPVRFENATDPFFRPAQNPKAFSQRLDPVKSEMVWDGRLAIGSVNFHRNYFGEAFRIQREGEDAFSGCVAFGLERWMSLVVQCFGADPKNWPEPFALDSSEVRP